MNSLLDKLHNRDDIIGVLSPSSDPVIVEMMGICGLDYFMVEGEHGAPGNLEEVCRAAEVTGIVPLARVRNNEPKLILQYLEAGMKGIMLPGVEEASEVKGFVKALKYPPIGTRGLGPSRANRYLIDQDMPSVVSTANQEILAIVQIETSQAFQNLEEILSISGIDLIVIGTADLTLSLGHDSFNDEMKEITSQIIEASLSKKIPVGMVATDKSQVDQLRQSGVRFFINTLGNVVKNGSTMS